MSIPAISMLAGNPAGIGFWSHDRVAGLMPVFFPGIRVHTGPRVSGKDYGTLLLMAGSFRSALQGFLSRVPERIGYATDMRRILLTRPLKPPGSREHHHSLDYLRLAEVAGGSGTPHVPAPAVEPSSTPHAALFPGARYGGAKRWPGFRELAFRLTKETGLKTVLYGSADEREYLLDLASGIECCSAASGLDIPGLAAALMGSVLTVGNDSGGVHLAAALGIPTVTIFGSTSPEWTAPMGRHAARVTAGLECSPCYRRNCPRGEAECLRRISAGEVLNESLALLKRSGEYGNA